MDSLGLDMSNIPAGIPPAGHTPNFVNPESLGNMPKIFTYVTLPPMLILFTMRIFTRIKTSRTGIDDCKALPAIRRHDDENMTRTYSANPQIYALYLRLVFLFLSKLLMAIETRD
jgi:hypothetical protein